MQYIDKEQLMAKEMVALRKGLTSKQTFRVGDTVWGIVDTDKLEPLDRDPTAISNFISGYINGLHAAGIPTVDVLGVETDGKNVVVKTTYMPNFLDIQMQAKEYDFYQGIKSILQMIHLSAGSNVGIDPTPKNFAVCREGIRYADFYHPFTTEYLAWTRSHMDMQNPLHRYHYFSQDYMFHPRVYAHAVADFIDIGAAKPQTIVKFVSEFCNCRLNGFDLEQEFDYYRQRKSELKSAL